MNAFAWMAWTAPVAIFSAGLGLLLVAMTVWEILSPTRPRRGLLPIVTTRGDRLFIGLLAAAHVNLGWIGATDLDPKIGLAMGGAVLLSLMRWG
jgi:predicted small integral membrane protein